MVGIVVKKYEHFNRAMGKHIKSKRHYKEEMEKGGFVSFNQGQQAANAARQKREEKYKPSSEALAIMRAAKNRASKDGKVKLSGAMVDGMKKLGMAFGHEHAPRELKTEGGFT